MDTIGKRIKTLRKAKGLTQKALGELCGMADSAIRRYENDYSEPKAETLKRISSALGVSWYELYPEEQQGQAIIDSFLDDLGGKPRVKQRIDKALDKLTEEGMKEAAKRVEELTEIPKYQKSPSEDNQGNGNQE